MPDDDLAVRKRFDLGVLFVHGIGQSQRGQTLATFAEPLLQWLEMWLGRAYPARKRASWVEVENAALEPPGDDPLAPAHAEVTLWIPRFASNRPTRRRWLVAESWWAETFLPPTYLDLVAWGLQVLPWTLIGHFHRRFQYDTAKAEAALRRSRWTEEGYLLPVVGWQERVVRLLKLFAELGYLIVALVLAPVLIIVVVGLLVVGLVPVPRVRRAVGAVQRGLAASVGDSYALLGRKVAAGAVYGQVRRDLDWLVSKGCRSIAVVAHSQGAAIAYRVASREATHCDLLLTFGSGLLKLSQMRQIMQLSSFWLWVASLGVLSMVLPVPLLMRELGPTQAVATVVLVTLIMTAVVAGTQKLLWWAGSEELGPALMNWSKGEKAIRVWQGLSRRTVAVSTARLLAMVGAALAAGWWVPELVAGGVPTWVRLVAIWFAVGPWAVQVTIREWSRQSDLFRFSWQLFPRSEHLESPRPVPEGEAPLPDSVRWLDVFSTADPVPNGPIDERIWVEEPRGESTAFGMTTLAVHNSGSALSDHSDYLKNPEQFLSVLAGELGDLSNLDLRDVVPWDQERLLLARERRRWRVRLLTAARALVGTAVALVVTIRRSELDTLASSLWTRLAGVPYLADWAPDEISVGATGGLATVMAAGLLAYGLVRLSWTLWGREDLEALANRIPYRRRWGQVAFVTFLAWSVALGVASAFGAPRLPLWAWTGNALALPLLGWLGWTRIPQPGLEDVVSDIPRLLHTDEDARSIAEKKEATGVVVIDRDRDDPGSWLARWTFHGEDLIGRPSVAVVYSPDLAPLVEWGLQKSERVHVPAGRGSTLRVTHGQALVTLHREEGWQVVVVLLEGGSTSVRFSNPGLFESCSEAEAWAKRLSVAVVAEREPGSGFGRSS